MKTRMFCFLVLFASACASSPGSGPGSGGAGGQGGNSSGGSPGSGGKASGEAGGSSGGSAGNSSGGSSGGGGNASGGSGGTVGSGGQATGGVGGNTDVNDAGAALADGAEQCKNAQAADVAANQSVQTNVPFLKDVFANDFKIGCLLSYRHVGFSDDPVVPGQAAVVAPHGGKLIKYHMNSMTPGNNMKPQYTVDVAGSAAAYDAATDDDKELAETRPIVKFNADLTAQLNWAKRSGFTFRGHTLVWHSQTPKEFFPKMG